MSTLHTIAAVVLAAGRASRMGEQKLLLPLGGRPLVSYAISAAVATEADPVVVILGHDGEHVRRALAPGRYQCVTNPHYHAGMSTSLRTGIAALPASVDGAIILLADQPLVTAQLIMRMLTQATQSPRSIIAASYAGKRGNPVYFPRDLFGELLMVTGDEGGRTVIARHPDRLHLVDVPTEETTFDVDRPEDYQRLRRYWTHHLESGCD